MEYESPTSTVTQISGKWADGQQVDLPEPITWDQFLGGVPCGVVKHQNIKVDKVLPIQDSQEPTAIKTRPPSWYQNYLVASIIATIFFCPIGIAATARSWLGLQAAQKGLDVEAQRHIVEARILIPLAILAGLTIVAVILALYFHGYLQ